VHDGSDRAGLVELIVPFLAVVALCLAPGLAPVRQWLDRHRPATGAVETRAMIERQWLHLEQLAVRPGPPRSRVLLLGSSSVVNGVDLGLVAERWRERGLALGPVNFGLTGFTAYELPFLRELLLTPQTAAVVFLYNPFSFGDRFHPQAVGTRWDSGEALRFYRAGCRRFEMADARAFSVGLAGEALFAVRYRHLLRGMVGLALRGRLAEPRHDYDYPPDQPALAKVPDQPEPPLPDDNWIRASYLASAAPGTLGACGLRRLADLLRRAGIPLVLGPVPEADFADLGRYRQGVDVEAVHRRAAASAVELAVPLLPRERAIERDAALFRDETHLNPRGRAIYSRALADRLASLLERR